MGTYDFDRFKDNSNTYLCKDSKVREDLATAKAETDIKFNNFKKEVDKKFEDLKNRYVLIGDSYLDGYTPDGHVNDFGGKLKTMLKCSDGDFYQKSKGGTGFSAASGGKTFITLINDIYPSISHPETITHVIFAGGYNDASFSSEDIQNAIASCYARVMEKFPNSTMYVANIGSCFNKAQQLWYLHDHVNHAYSYCSINNEHCVYLGYIGNALHERGMLASDGVHPTDWGQGIIATSLFFALNGREFFPVGRFHGFDSAYTEGTHNTVVSGFEYYTKNEVCITIKNVYFHNQESVPTEKDWCVGRITGCSYIRSGYDTMTTVQAGGIICYDGGHKFINAPVTIGIGNDGKNSNFYVRIHAVNREGTNYETLNNVAYINFSYATLRVPISYI